ncbi:MAG: electron transfer flavoprotein subunit beta/FixA family protein [Saprospiraceae bacterium]|nr:electron transfer flavoprotein subunit beta/FixA family protein [Bacteroidia bacterium]NNF20693.1 electron transfer flavoprotein subunit beta/FixA family protein [Saprospiraceae bacterium]NNK90723.1 electron transfer flavoprotein subunit beta/FixA family protein [Saprospiraceae bacterium]
MKILVCISKTPETTAKIAFTDNNTALDPNGVQFILNPYDEWFALVRALELKEELGGTVTVINVGPASNDVIIRKALAIGADEAIRVDAEATGARFVADQVANYAKGNDYDLILTGKETIDYNGSEVGSMIAELLELPFQSFARELTMEGDNVIITREIEGGTEKSKSQLPLVVSAAKGMAEQRIPNMRGIMMAKRKPLNVIPAVESSDGTKLSTYSLPAEKSSVKMIDPENMDELVRLLKEEAKVI